LGHHPHHEGIGRTVTPKLPELRVAPVTGSGPHGRIELGDIRAKLQEIRGEVDETAEKARPYMTYAAVGAVIVVVTAAFLLVRRRGLRKATWVEIRRL
jgi:hypothetical protein